MFYFGEYTFSNPVYKCPMSFPQMYRIFKLYMNKNCSYVFHSAFDYDTENMNSDDIYSSLRGVTEAIQSFSFRSQEDMSEPLKRDPRKDDGDSVSIWMFLCCACLNVLKLLTAWVSVKVLIFIFTMPSHIFTWNFLQVSHSVNTKYQTHVSHFLDFRFIRRSHCPQVPFGFSCTDEHCGVLA
jgi:hypothetical protein